MRRFLLPTFALYLLLPTLLIAQNQEVDVGDHRSKVAFQLAQTGLITEGIAHDSQTGAFYISSVHTRKIIRYDLKNGATDFSKPADSLWGIFGMKVDPSRRLLWACSSALVQAEGVTASKDGQTALVVLT